MIYIVAFTHPEACRYAAQNDLDMGQIRYVSRSFKLIGVKPPSTVLVVGLGRFRHDYFDILREARKNGLEVKHDARPINRFGITNKTLAIDNRTHRRSVI